MRILIPIILLVSMGCINVGDHNKGVEWSRSSDTCKEVVEL